MNLRISFNFVIGAIIALATWLRLLAVPPVVGDTDGVNFARGLAHFDPLQQAPHLPGYPVYVAAAKPFAALGFDDAAALAAPAILSWPLALALLFVALRRRAGDVAALLSVAFLGFAPGLVLLAGWPASDGFGLSLLVLGAALLLHDGGAAGAEEDTAARRGRPLPAALLGGICLGLLLGVRLSWAPAVLSALVLAWLAHRGRGKRAVVGCLVATAAWAMPFAALLGVDGLRAGLAFGEGHMTQWGGSAAATGAAADARLVEAFARVFVHGFGVTRSVAGVVIALALIAAAFALARRRGPRVLLFAAVAVVPYGAWVLVGQNVHKPRHLAPVVALLAVVAALAFGAGVARRGVGLGLALTLALVAGGLAAEQGAQLSPAARLVVHVGERAPAGMQVFAGEEARLFQYLAPAHRVWRPASSEVLAREAELAHSRGAAVFVSSSAPVPAEMWAHLEPTAEFSGSPRVWATDHSLVLYRYTPRVIVGQRSAP
jgi:hypothetical protein